MGSKWMQKRDSEREQRPARDPGRKPNQASVQELGRIPAFWRSGLVFGAVTLFLVCGILLSAAMTVRGIGYPPRLRERRAESEYRELERAYREALRTYLEASGYRNAGVTLTHTTDADGNRTYLVCVHHDRLDRLGEEAREALRAELCAMGFADERSEFRAEIL